MLRGLKLVGHAGTGHHSIADIYEKGGKKYVLRTFVIPLNSVFINKDGNYQLIYKDSYSENEYPIIRELMFYDLIANMPDNEAKYFVKLIKYDITKSPDRDGNKINFDSSRIGCNTCLSSIPIDKRIYMRQLIEYAGEPVTGNLDKVAADLINIVKISRKYGWLLADIHINNIRAGNVTRLIDYEFNHPINDNQPYSIIMNYQANTPMRDVLSIVSGYDNVKFNMYNISDRLLTKLVRLKCYVQITKYMNQAYGKSKHKNYISHMMKDIKSGILIDEYKAYYRHIFALWLAIDKKTFDSAMIDEYPEYKSPDRASNKMILSVLSKL